VVFWVVLVGDPELTTTISVPLEFRNLPRDLDINSETPEVIQVELQGPSAKLAMSKTRNLAVLLDVSAVTKSGEKTFSIIPGNLNLPAGVQLKRSIPSQIQLRFEHRMLKEIPIKVRFSGPPPDGYRVKDQEVIPETIRIVGPESRVVQVQTAETDPIDLGGVVGDREFETSIFVAEPLVRIESQPRVRVKVTLEKLPVKGN
jgi:YbbR domain-containing protein